MPLDGRFKENRRDAPGAKFNGHSPRNMPLDDKGLIDFEPGLKRKERLEAAKNKTPLAADGLPDFDAMPSPGYAPETGEDADEEEWAKVEETISKMKPNPPKPQEDF